MATDHSTTHGGSRIGRALRSDPAEWVSDEWRERLWKGFIAFWALYILVPPVMLLLISVDTASFVRVPGGFTLEKYRMMLRTEQLIASVWRSLVFAVITMVIAPLLALLAVLSYRKTEYKALFLGAVILPLFVPGVVQGFSLMMLFQRIQFNQPFVAVLIGHVIWAFPFSFLVLLTTYASVPEDVLLASADLGATEFDTFRYVIYPLVKPGLISAVIFSFVLSFNEFSRTIYLKGRGNTVPTYVWAKLQVELSPEVFAVAGITVLLSLGLIGVGTLYLYRAETGYDVPEEE